MNTRTTWILALLAAGLALWIVLVRKDRSGGRLSSPVVFDPASVSSVELTRSNLTVRVERKDGRWLLRQPIQAVAQAPGIDDFLEALNQMSIRARIPASEIANSPEAIRALGLDASATQIRIELLSGATQLRIGGLAPVGSQFYFQAAGSSDIYTADTAFLKSLPTTANQWRDHALVDWGDNTPEIDRIEVRGQSGFEAVREPSSDKWRLTKPLSARADRARLETVLALVRTARVLEFVSDGPVADAEVFGLQRSALELVVGRGTNDRARLQFGSSPTNAPDTVFVRNLARTNIVLIPKDLWTVLRQPVATFRDHQLLPSLADVTDLEFATPSERARIHREGTNWWVTSPSKFRADSAVMSLVFRQFQHLPIIDFPADVVAKPETYGLQNPLRQYWFRKGSTNSASATTNEIVAELAIGGLAGPSGIYARRSDEPSIYTVPNILPQLPESANQLRDWRFDPGMVHRIQITHTNASRELVRSESGAWQDATRGGQAIDSEAVDEILFRLGYLVSPRYAIPNETLLESGGFKQRAHEMILHLRGDNPPFQRWRLRFGGELVESVVTLANFDGDPIALRIGVPVNLYGDIFYFLGGTLR